MIPLSAAATSALTRSWTLHRRVQSWLGDQLLDDDVPVDDGGEDLDRSLRVPERVNLTVPRLDRGTSYDPASDDHPLAARGQHLVISLGIGLAGDQIEWFQRGEFVITDSRAEAGAVRVEAAGLLWLVDEARLVSPYQPGGTLASTLRGLVEPALTVVVDAALADRSVPAGINFDEDRLGAVLELLDAWPAESSVTAEGYLSVTPTADSTTPVWTLTDGVGGTVLTWGGQSSREGCYTAVVARGVAPDGGQVQGVAYDRSGGPLAVGGPFNPLPVPAMFDSPLLTTVPQCQAAAATRLATLRRQSTRRIVADCVPHPGLQLGDCVAVTGKGLVAHPCIVETLRQPWTPGVMTVGLRVVG